MYLVDFGMGISRCLAKKLHDPGLRRQSLFGVARLFSGSGNWAGEECGRLAHIYPLLLQGKATRPSLLYSRVDDEPLYHLNGSILGTWAASCFTNSHLAIRPSLGMTIGMRIFLIGVLLSLSFGALQAQQGLQPKYDISPSIAKLPEQSDFFGTWLRSDGTYRVEIEAGKQAGIVVARYFNPEPINVETSTFDEIEGQPRLEFVLRDEGYPGSAYRLIYLAERRVLVGTYARPDAEPSQVFFVREEEQ
jgi:hypothetical protein